MIKVFRRNRNRIRQTKFDTVIDIINIVILLSFVVIIAYPVISYLSLAFSSGVRNSEVVLFPVGWTIEPFRWLIAGGGSDIFMGAVRNSVFITLVVTIGSNLIMALAAYPLSKPSFPFRKFWLMFFIVTMLFSAGIVPIWLLMLTLNLINSIWSLILISMSNVFHMLLFKTFFENLPSDMEEAARIDGASAIKVFCKIVIPLSLPIFGTTAFFTLVGTWNSYGAALLFISANATESWTLAYYIFMQISTAGDVIHDPWLIANMQNVTAAAIVVSIVPILLVYPYIMKYIKSGLTIGSVKG